MGKAQKKYKQLEKNLAYKLRSLVANFFKFIGGFFVKAFKILDSKLTIMIVPHSQTKVINFQTNVFALAAGTIITIGVVSSFFYFNRKSILANSEISALQTQNRETLASLDQLRDENANLFQAAKRFQTSLSQSISLLGITQAKSNSNTSFSNSDLSSLFNTKDVVTGTMHEVEDIRQLTSYLEDAVQPIEQIGRLLETQQNLFSEIPSIWPIKNPNTHVSMAFGPNMHPTKGYWYIHKGLDLSTWSQGDPVVATASGQVVNVGYDNNFGNCVIIRHKHGMYTRYAHLRDIIVKRGDTISQGQMIGHVGSTGISTGPHLHYEVHIGSDVVDPAKYLNVTLFK